jgi:hypothetical protein
MAAVLLYALLGFGTFWPQNQRVLTSSLEEMEEPMSRVGGGV